MSYNTVMSRERGKHCNYCDALGFQRHSRWALKLNGKRRTYVGKKPICKSSCSMWLSVSTRFRGLVYDWTYTYTSTYAVTERSICKTLNYHVRMSRMYAYATTAPAIVYHHVLSSLRSYKGRRRHNRAKK